MRYLTIILSLIFRKTLVGALVVCLLGIVPAFLYSASARTGKITPQQPRVLRVKEDSFLRGAENHLRVELVSQGDENAIGFTVKFDADHLDFVRATVGSDAESAILSLNTDRVSEGVLGVGLVLPGGQAFAPGVDEVLQIVFSAPVGGSVNRTVVGFNDLQVAREIVDAEGNVLPADYLPGVIPLRPEVASTLNPVPRITTINPEAAPAGVVVSH